MLAAIGFNVSELTNLSLYYIFYDKFVVLQLDNMLNLHRLYYGEEHRNITPQGKQPASNLVRKNLKNERKHQIEKSNISTYDVVFKVGDYNGKHHSQGKLDMRWQYYVI